MKDYYLDAFVVAYLINTNNELYETYQIYQSILYSIDTKNKNIFFP